MAATQDSKLLAAPVALTPEPRVPIARLKEETEVALKGRKPGVRLLNLCWVRPSPLAGIAYDPGSMVRPAACQPRRPPSRWATRV
jgi:hypothetical protein